MDQSGTLFDRSCIVSVRSSENRFHSLEVHPAIAKSAEPCSWKSKGVDCQSSELDCKSFELDCTSFERECISCFSFACIVLLDVHVLQCRSCPRNNRSCQFRAACRSCVGNCCQGIQFCLQKPSNYLAEAVHRFCRCLTVATVLDSSCLVMSVHVMFISLFLNLMSTVFFCN